MIDEVDPTDPAVVVPEVDLTLEGRLAGVPEDRLEAVLEPALDRPVVGAALECEAADRRGAPSAAPAGEAGDVLVELRHPQQPLRQHALAQQVEAVPVQAPRQVAERAQR